MRLGGPLARLSIQRVTGLRAPQSPSNAERIAAYRPYMAAVTTRQLSEAERYAANESIENSTPTTDVHYREWNRD